MDWNNDGREDWEDEFLFENDMIGSHEENPPDGGRHPLHSIGRVGKILVIAAAGYILLLLQGTIPINVFTMIIGSFCLGIILIRFLI